MGKSSNEIDMLHGPLLMKIIVFALPLAASSIMQQLFNSVDVAVVGRFVNSQALAAVGSNAPVISLLINLFMGISMGANVIISNHIGQKDSQGIQDAIGTALVVAVASGLALMAIGVTAARPLLTLIGTPPDVLPMAVDYLRTFFLGIPFFMVFDFGAAILRSKGDTRRPLYILFIAGIVNTVLNLVFVLVFHTGVIGVAIATDIANAASAIMIVWLLMKEKAPYTLRLKQMRLKWGELKRIMQIGIPAGVQGLVFSVSNVLLQSTINSHGADAIAGSAAALNFEHYCYFIMVAFNGAAISFISQNYGAGNIQRVKRTYIICMTLSVVLSGTFNLLFVWQHDTFLHLFSTDDAVCAYGAKRMHIVLAVQFLACSYEISAAAMRGLGKSVLPTLLMLFGTCVLRIVWVYAVCPVWTSFDTIMMVYPISWVITGIMVCAAFAITMKRIMREKRQQASTTITHATITK